MNPQLEQDLVARYPEIFRHAGGDPTKTCMAWGLEIGDGWFNLIDACCASMVATLRHQQSRLARLEAAPQPDDDAITAQRALVASALEAVPVAAQVKEKFGGLRFYVDGGTPEHRACIALTERLSYCTCEQCGAAGQSYNLGWVRTLCPEHADVAHGEKAAQYRQEYPSAYDAALRGNPPSA
jgi:hypothetical protein